MAAARMPEEFYDQAAHHLPPGGRTRRDGMFGPHGGPPPEGVGIPGRLGPPARRPPRALKRTGRLDPETVVVDGVTFRAFGGGKATGSSPVDRGRKGTKHTLMVDRRGVPPAIQRAGANASDHRQILLVVLAFPKVGGRPGRPKERPDDLFADRGCDSEGTRGLLRWLGIESHVARRNTPHGSGLGKVRWVVERTISWLKGLRRMRVRYDRLPVVREAWTTLAASVICYRLLHDDLPSAG